MNKNWEISCELLAWLLKSFLQIFIGSFSLIWWNEIWRVKPKTYCIFLYLSLAPLFLSFYFLFSCFFFLTINDLLGPRRQVFILIKLSNESYKRELSSFVTSSPCLFEQRLLLCYWWKRWLHLWLCTLNHIHIAQYWIWFFPGIFARSRQMSACVGNWRTPGISGDRPSAHTWAPIRSHPSKEGNAKLLAGGWVS